MGKILPICGMFLVLATLVHANGIQLGCINCAGDKLLLHEVVQQSAESFIKSHRSKVYPSISSGHKIKGISVVDVQGDGYAHLTEGGIGQDYVYIEMTGAKGYHFIVDVYAG